MFDILPLLEQAGYTPAGNDFETWETLTMDFGVTVDPEYRRDGTCGRVVVVSSIDETALEAFVVLGSSVTLTFVDSLGKEVARVGGPGPTPRDLPHPTPTSSLQFDSTDYTVRSQSHAYDLSALLPNGRWYARPVGVRYRGSDLVVVNKCDPYSPGDGFCGLENDGERPLADPPAPLVTSFGLFDGEGGAARAEIIDDEAATSAADFPGAPLWGKAAVTLEAHGE